jgi:hypothetical protein
VKRLLLIGAVVSVAAIAAAGCGSDGSKKSIVCDSTNTTNMPCHPDPRYTHEADPFPRPLGTQPETIWNGLSTTGTPMSEKRHT